MGWARRLTPREKTIRLVTVCLLAAILGIIAVALDNEAVGARRWRSCWPASWPVRWSRATSSGRPAGGSRPRRAEARSS